MAFTTNRLKVIPVQAFFWSDIYRYFMMNYFRLIPFTQFTGRMEF